MTGLASSLDAALSGAPAPPSACADEPSLDEPRYSRGGGVVAAAEPASVSLGEMHDSCGKKRELRVGGAFRVAACQREGARDEARTAGGGRGAGGGWGGTFPPGGTGIAVGVCTAGGGDRAEPPHPFRPRVRARLTECSRDSAEDTDFFAHPSGDWGKSG